MREASLQGNRKFSNLTAGNWIRPLTNVEPSDSAPLGMSCPLAGATSRRFGIDNFGLIQAESSSSKNPNLLFLHILYKTRKKRRKNGAFPQYLLSQTEQDALRNRRKPASVPTTGDRPMTNSRIEKVLMSAMISFICMAYVVCILQWLGGV